MIETDQPLVYQLTNSHEFDRSDPLHLIRFAQYGFSITVCFSMQFRIGALLDFWSHEGS